MPIKWGDGGPEKEWSRGQAVSGLAELGLPGRGLGLVLTGRAGTVFLHCLTPNT